MLIKWIEVTVELLFETELAIKVKSPFGKVDIWIPKSLLQNPDVADMAEQFSEITLELSENVALEKELI